MDIKEVEKEYCSRCPSYKYECGFITRGLQDKCVQLSDYTDGYERGYEQAEKDNELTWKDISKIISIDQQVCGTMGISDYTHNYQQAMEEVLKRFNDQRRK